ncbi:tetratricopeptide repeat protein [Chryseobacterium populi]|uniref:Transcriptional regulator, luxR family n=1 Tax=Chryseobacterium populi TaxID=1144316 RepID=J2K6E9_9FLAO|nr:hypothetical protein [Chryseobacterium populi]EJL75795.1 transcriptional regulator, luxR family [Chryseobacterium populi]
MTEKVVQLLSFFSLFFSLTGYSQNKKEEFKNQVMLNSKIFNTNIDKAYHQLDSLLYDARALKDSISELKLLDRKCRYFYSKNMMDSLIILSEKLQKKSNEYNIPYFEAMSNIYMAETYSVNKFYDKAIYYLNSAYKILQEDKTGSEKIFYAKANVLNSFANVYLDKNDPKSAAKKIYQQIKSGSEIKDPKKLASFQYLNYSNLSNIYIQYNSDSAYYYANKSINIKPATIAEDKSMITNYTVIGEVYKQKKNYPNSIKYFHKALTASKKNGIELNMNNVYEALKEIYLKTGRKDSVIFYKNKIEQYDLQVLESKYNSLQEVINKDKKEEDESSSKNLLLWSILLGVSIIVLMITFIKVRNKKIRVTDQNLQKTYNHLIELLQNKDPSFIFSFENAFPDFSDKLLKKKPELQQSEIEFCALLKMKLTTKEIAKYTYIETRTVQNKKYKLRKKLGIPQNVDIYQWINNL